MEIVVILQGCSLQWRESGHVTEVVSLREGEWSCYGGGLFNGGGNGRVREVASLMEEEWSCYRGGHSWRENDHVTEVVSLMEGEWLLQRTTV